MKIQLLSSSLFALIATLATVEEVKGQQQYGVDCSFPIHHKEIKCPPGVDLGDRQKFYDDFMQGCRDHYGGKRGGRACDVTEDGRIEMSLGQPQSMRNYTDTGFKKIKAPDDVMKLLIDYWETNRKLKEEEVWSKGNIYVNHWRSPTYMVSVENRKLTGGGPQLKQRVWDLAQSTIEEWTGMELTPTSMYGIRVYTEGAVLSPHVDRNPLVSSCIINVAQDVDEPWPLEVIDRFGNAVNVTMEVGDMVLYESGSLIHARPFALKGRFYANIFIHFEPTGKPIHDEEAQYMDELDEFLPPYVIPGSLWEHNWRNSHSKGWQRTTPHGKVPHTKEDNPHFAASMGDVDRLKWLARNYKGTLHRKDENGWTALHEAVRGGFTESVQFLVDHGADVNVRTGRRNQGVNALSLAEEFLPKNHPIIQILNDHGAERLSVREEL